MNKWECETPGCVATAVGIGGAVGLRAIGWYFLRGPVIYCPAHHPQGIARAAVLTEEIQREVAAIDAT